MNDGYSQSKSINPNNEVVMAKDDKPKSEKLSIGTVYQKIVRGSYYFRYQINGQRKSVPLKTKNFEEAISKATKMLPILQARTLEIVSAHVKEARGMVKKQLQLPLSETWALYAKSPERATPATVSEQLGYQSSWGEFISFCREKKVFNINEVIQEHITAFAEDLKTQNLSVSTHNRKLKRIRKVFQVLHEYCPESPRLFDSKTLFRKPREEQATLQRRQAFTREQEQSLLKVFDDPQFHIMNKAEIKVIYHIGMFTGQRLKDCVLLQWQDIDMRKQRIQVKQFKTGKEVSIPIAGKLLLLLEEAKTWRVDQYVCPKTAERYNRNNQQGKNVGNNLVNLDVTKVIRRIGLEPSVAMTGRDKKVTIYGFHSLRHSFASHCAEAGVPKAVLLSILGTDSDIADKYYTHIGEAAQEQAIAAISDGIDIKSDRAKIIDALALIANYPKRLQILEKIAEILK